MRRLLIEPAQAQKFNMRRHEEQPHESTPLSIAFIQHGTDRRSIDCVLQCGAAGVFFGRAGCDALSQGTRRGTSLCAACSGEKLKSLDSSAFA